MPLRRGIPALLVGLTALGWNGLPLRGQPAAQQLLEEGKKLSRQGKTEEAARHLRLLLKDFPEASQAQSGRDLLAEMGYGLNYRVKLEDRRQLFKVQVTEEKVARQVEGLLEELLLFFQQTYGPPPPFEFHIVVYDSRPKFRADFPYPRWSRRSAYSPMPAGPAGEQRGKIAVYFDLRNASRQDVLDLLYGSLSREAALGLSTFFARRPLPEALRAGLAEYLAARLFPNKLVGLAQAQEEILRGVARESLAKVQKLEDFKKFLLSSSPEGEGHPALLWYWRGRAYGIIDCLLHGELAEEKSKEAKAVKKGRSEAATPPLGGAVPEAAGKKPPGLARNAQLQSWLRDFEAVQDAKPAAAGSDPLQVFEILLKRHFDLGLEPFHQSYFNHVQKYSPKHPDFEHFSE
ncbi:MAG: hypothetical protein HY717_04870 [Planctomycetes bacterium]|nr:hypothetical protein [Planctomycetota bacterium]